MSGSPSHVVSQAHAWRRRRQLRSTQRAGAYSRRELQRLKRRWLRRSWKAVVAVMALIALGAVAAQLFLPDEIAPYVAGAIGVSGLWLNYVFMLQTSGVMSHVVGVMGEEWTTDELNKLRRRGWHLVNHVMLEHVDVDHVLLGPGGFFTIETKFRSDPERITDDDLAGWARRANRSARDVRTRLQTSQRMSPIVAVWGPGSGDVLGEVRTVDGVIICAGANLLATIEDRAEEVTVDVVRAAFGHLDDYVRRRDIGEARTQGAIPRRMSEYSLDLVGGTSAAIATIWLALSSAALPFGLVWPVVLAVGIGAAALLARRAHPQHERLRAVTTGCIAASGALLVLIVVALLVALAA